MSSHYAYLMQEGSREDLRLKQYETFISHWKV